VEDAEPHMNRWSGEFACDIITDKWQVASHFEWRIFFLQKDVKRSTKAFSRKRGSAAQLAHGQHPNGVCGEGLGAEKNLVPRLETVAKNSRQKGNTF